MDNSFIIIDWQIKSIINYIVISVTSDKHYTTAAQANAICICHYVIFATEKEARISMNTLQSTQHMWCGDGYPFRVWYSIASHITLEGSLQSQPWSQTRRVEEIFRNNWYFIIAIKSVPYNSLIELFYSLIVIQLLTVLLLLLDYLNWNLCRNFMNNRQQLHSVESHEVTHRMIRMKPAATSVEDFAGSFWIQKSCL